MGWASGVFSRVRDWTADAAVPLNIEATLMDQEDDNFELGIDTCLTKDGQNTPTTNLPMDGNRHTGVGNAAAKTDYASAADVIDQHLLFYVDTGAADAYVITPSPSISAYAEGQRLIFRATNTNTGTSTLNVNALGTRIIHTSDDAVLAAGAIINGGYYEVTYDANPTPDRFVLTSPSALTPIVDSGNQTLDGVLTTEGIVIEDTGNTDDITITHDGTDANIVGTNTTDLNITGITAIAAGTVDADFDAITGTSYGGITEANLVDKSATETISAIWTFTAGIDLNDNDNLRFGTGNDVVFDFNATNFITVGSGTWNISGFTAVNAGTVDADFDAITATSYGGITEANLVDKSASETISGVWTHTNVLSIQAAAPELRWRETGATADEGRWDLRADNDTLIARAVTDDFASADVIYTVNRTGVTVDNFTFSVPIVATSYGGITEANLVDKAATETISGAWTHSGRLVTDDSTTTRAGFNIPEGTAPTSPVDGDMWVTTTDILARVNGVSKTLVQADAAASTTNPIDISSDVISLDVEALTTIEGSALAATDTFYVEDAGVSKGVEVQAMGLQVQLAQATQTLAAPDMNTIMEFTATSTLTLPLNATVALPIGVPIVLNVKHATQVLTVTAAASVTLVSINHPAGTAAASDTVNAGGSAVLYKTAADVWALTGDTSD